MQVYTNKIKDKIFLKKIKTGHKLELISPETMILLGSKKKMLVKIKMDRICQS